MAVGELDVAGSHVVHDVEMVESEREDDDLQNPTSLLLYSWQCL
jgi:hypothetical protein